MDDEGSTSIDEHRRDASEHSRPRAYTTRSSDGSISSGGTTTNAPNGIKRQKEMPPCFVCGAKANGYNFDQITCESCKAFFRRNALKPQDKFRCRNNGHCVITTATRKRCKLCRLAKCFHVGMRKEWILSEEEKCLKRRKIEQNRTIKQNAQLTPHQTTSNMAHTDLTVHMESNGGYSQITEALIIVMPVMRMYPPSDQHMYERHRYLLKHISGGYQSLTNQYPQPNKFAYRNAIISHTSDMDSKLALIKDLTHELTQMTTLRLLNFFNLIPEFQVLSPLEKQQLLTENMLPVFMFHGALTYNSVNDTFVDRATNDQPYDAKYLLFVYGPRIYHHFITLARQLTSVIYQPFDSEQLDERAHTLFLLLMAVLLFSNGFQTNSIGVRKGDGSELGEKSVKIQQHYVELSCQLIHDHFGTTVGRRIFQRLVPLLLDLQKLCSTLAKVNICEMAEEDDRLPSSTPTNTNDTPAQLPVMETAVELNSTMISETSHLNELQKENRAPLRAPPSMATSVPFSPTVQSPPSACPRTVLSHSYPL